MTNAHKFVADFGIDVAKEVLEGAPDGHKGYNDVINQYTRGVWFSRDVMLSDLKRLVESIDLVEKLGGLSKAKYTLLQASDGVIDCTNLIRAIRDHESIYGGGDE